MAGSETTQRQTMRLDNALVARGLAPSRARARDAIKRGCVTVDGMASNKPAQTVAPDARIEVDDPGADYVSRAALKLIAALDHFGYSAEDRTALDIGASTGGFVDVLLRRGARKVYAVDVGHEQLARRLATDPRVVNIEGINARDLKLAGIGERMSAITADVSFISLKLALPPALAMADADAWGVFLVKPQFEVGRDHIGKGGIVRDPAAARATADDIAGWLASEMGWRVDGVIASPITGADGNQEYLVGARRG